MKAVHRAAHPELFVSARVINALDARNAVLFQIFRQRTIARQLLTTGESSRMTKPATCGRHGLRPPH